MEKARIENVNINEMFVPEYKQSINLRNAEKMQKNFNASLMAPICVNKRDDGIYAVIDGAMRMAVLKKLGYKEALCKVYAGLSPEDETRIFMAGKATKKRMEAE